MAPPTSYRAPSVNPTDDQLRREVAESQGSGFSIDNVFVNNYIESEYKEVVKVVPNNILWHDKEVITIYDENSKVYIKIYRVCNAMFKSIDDKQFYEYLKCHGNGKKIEEGLFYAEANLKDEMVTFYKGIESVYNEWLAKRKDVYNLHKYAIIRLESNCDKLVVFSFLDKRGIIVVDDMTLLSKLSDISFTGIGEEGSCRVVFL